MKPELIDYSKEANIQYGKLYIFDMVMEQMPDKRSRTIRVWLPESYDGVKRYPVMYMHDGQNNFDGAGVVEPKWYCDRGMKTLAPEGIEAIVVSIDTSDDRGSELLPPLTRNPNHRIPRLPGAPAIRQLGGCYADFVKDSLKPVIDETFMTLPDAAHTGIGGSSMGGLQSFYMVMRDPDVFGRGLLFSPGYGILDESCLELLDKYDVSKLENVRMFMWNGDQTLDYGILYPMLRVYRKLKDDLGLDYQHVACMVDTREAHYMYGWGKYFPEAMRYLFSEDNSLPQPPERSYKFERRPETDD